MQAKNLFSESYFQSIIVLKKVFKFVLIYELLLKNI